MNRYVAGSLILVFLTTLSFAQVLGADKPTASASEAVDPTANHYFKFWKRFFRGTWNAKIVAGDETGPSAIGTEFIWICRLAPTKSSMVFSSIMDGKPQYSAIAGYDPKTKAWKEVFYFLDGSHLVQLYTAEPSDLEAPLDGKLIKGTAEFVYPDGRVESCDIHVKIFSRNKSEYACTNRRIGDEKLPDMLMVFERETK